MFLGTHRDNSLDMVSKGRHGRYNALKTHCTNGHEFTEANTQVRPNGERRCRACGADYARRKRA
jgi:hypothetical protein